MISTILSTIYELLAIAWRRRYLVLVPMTVMITLSALTAVFAPKTYVSKTLLLLQERDRDDVFSRNSTPVRLQDTVGGLQALLKSDYVLLSAAKSIGGPSIADDPIKLESEKNDLEDEVSLDLVGNDFLELSIRGTHPELLGRKLEAVTIAFLEATLSEHGATSATGLLLEKRKKELEAGERELTELQKQLGIDALPPPAAERMAPPANQSDAEKLLAVKADEVRTMRERYEDFLKRYSNPAGRNSLGILNAPERIKLIDPPNDPKVLVRSGLRYLLAGIAASILLAFALVVFAEMFDARARPRDLPGITGSPFVVRLPRVRARTPKPSGESVAHGSGRIRPAA